MKYSVAESTTIDWELLKDEIKQAASSLGIDKIGFASADPFLELKQILINHREKGFESGFEEPDLDKRTHPNLTFDQPKSILSIAIAYPSKLKDPPKSTPGAYRGIISRSAWGEDYHHVLKKRLLNLENFIKDRVSDVRLESMVDTGVLVDRAVAERAGIGWLGKNCAVITPEFGSWVYLGEMITNLPFPPDTPVTEDCGDCTICIDACPTDALVGSGQLNSNRCISFVTQTKGFVSDELKQKIGNRLYGCDTCQVVCPKNKGKHFTHQPELEPDPEIVKPLLKPLLTLSNREFKEKYGFSAAAWRGKKPIQRNAVTALGIFKDQSAIPILKDILIKDQRPELREAAAWSLGKISTRETYEIIKQAIHHEKNDAVLDALYKAEQSVVIAES
ncbi:tRNA epoxyqueuosine(34) reductase QueG [Chengkuizengella axinellae]|uniref:tRNA epoxyqueuosine(34) reductase QueG n=1 Tax=Chengkuizengella axinellae TaxID=3064388 RepID=A0ABT9J079_9BACL|nr:tRNA epoxyqueuosine(34) reductase QueG [Chengkuizengella sp. 2205SS18-9]MDP5275020.1 tRNA epoxyqueuosine(34) reductase QueG [Chengkuizengella sp. 2205SS18-9]